MVNINQIATDDPKGLINIKNYNIQKDIEQGLIKTINNSTQEQYILIENFFTGEIKETIDNFFFDIWLDTLHKELDYIKEYVEKKDDESPFEFIIL